MKETDGITPSTACWRSSYGRHHAEDSVLCSRPTNHEDGQVCLRMMTRFFHLGVGFEVGLTAVVLR